MKIPINDLTKQNQILRKKFFNSIKKVFNHSKYILGPEVEVLENKLKSYCGAKYCVSTSSGTDALLISLMPLGIKRGDEVITTPFTYVSTAEVILRVGAKPVFADIENKTFNIDPKKIKSKINNKTKAIIVVSLFGEPANIREIKKYTLKVPIIEDAAQSFGSSHYTKKSCNLSLIGCTSFFPTKTLSCYGDGGAIFTSNKSLYKKIKSIRVHGQTKKYNYKVLGISARLDTLQASFLIEKLKLLDEEIKKRKEIYNLYKKNFLKVDEIEIFQPKKFNKPNYVIFPMTIKNKKRNKLKAYLQKKGIQTIIYYPYPLNKFDIFDKKSDVKSTPNALSLSKSIISLPMSPYMSKKEVNYVINNVIKFFR